MTAPGWTKLFGQAELLDKKMQQIKQLHAPDSGSRYGIHSAILENYIRQGKFWNLANIKGYASVIANARNSNGNGNLYFAVSSVHGPDKSKIGQVI